MIMFTSVKGKEFKMYLFILYSIRKFAGLIPVLKILIYFIFNKKFVWSYSCIKNTVLIYLYLIRKFAGLIPVLKYTFIYIIYYIIYIIFYICIILGLA